MVPVSPKDSTKGKIWGDNKNEMNVKDILEFLHTPNTCMKDDSSSPTVYATAICKFPPLDLETLIFFSSTWLKQTESWNETKFTNCPTFIWSTDQVAESRSMMSEFSALSKRRVAAEKVPSPENTATNVTSESEPCTSRSCNDQAKEKLPSLDEKPTFSKVVGKLPKLATDSNFSIGKSTSNNEN